MEGIDRQSSEAYTSLAGVLQKSDLSRLLYSGETRNLDFILFQFKKRGVLSLAFELALNFAVFLAITIGVGVFTTYGSGVLFGARSDKMSSFPGG